LPSFPKACLPTLKHPQPPLQSQTNKHTTTKKKKKKKKKKPGGTVDCRSVAVGDATLSVLEIWGAEYQENDCLLIKPEDRGKMEALCARERCIMQVRDCLVWFCFLVCCVADGGRLSCREARWRAPSAAPPPSPPYPSKTSAVMTSFYFTC